MKEKKKKEEEGWRNKERERAGERDARNGQNDGRVGEI